MRHWVILLRLAGVWLIAFGILYPLVREWSIPGLGYNATSLLNYAQGYSGEIALAILCFAAASVIRAQFQTATQNTH